MHHEPTTFIVTCPICGKTREKSRPNAVYCGPLCSKIAERRKRKEAMQTERLGLEVEKAVVTGQVMANATCDELTAIEAQLVAANVPDVRKFISPDVEWMPNDNRVSWVRDETKGLWGMIFHPYPTSL